MKLTPQQEKFCQEIIKGKSQYQAYITAYPKSKGWKRNSVDNAANKLRKNTEIIQRLDKLRGNVEEDINEIRAGLIDELDNIAKTNVGDFYEQVDDGDGGTKLKLKGFDEVDFRAVKKISFSRTGEPIVELYDKVQAINKLADMHGLNDKNIDTTVNIKLDDTFEGMCD